MMTHVATLFLIFAGVLLPCAALMSYLSRKIGADMQARVGPNRAGKAGIFQPVADLLKSLQKEDAASATSFARQLALAIQTALLFSTVTILPLSSGLLMLDADMSIFLALWVGLGASMISLFIGFQEGSVPGWTSALRISVQAVTGAFPALVALLCVGVQTGSFRWTKILAAQGASPFSWLIFSTPFAPLAFVVFVVSGLILFSIPPMDSGISRPEVVGGFSSLWGGRNLSLFSFGRFYGFFLWSTMAVTLFLGGWSVPQAVQDAFSGDSVLILFEAATLLIKCFVLMLLVGGVTRVNPKTRADQITAFAWRVLSPAALFSLMGAAAWRALWP
jgi:NADH-quinone oxidoreductase subunit H